MRIHWNLAAVAVAGLVAVSARAALPAVLDRVPEDAVAVVVIPNLAELDAKVQAFAQAADIPPDGPSPMQMLQLEGLDAGLKKDASAALFLTPGDFTASTPPAVLLLPTDDYDAFLQAASGGDVAKVDGLDTFVFNHETLYAKQVQGGYAALGPIADVVRDYTGLGGNLAGHATTLGANTTRIVEGADAAIIVRGVDELKAFFKERAIDIADEMRYDIGMSGMDTTWLDELEDASGRLIDDARCGALSMVAGPDGLAFHFAIDFESGSASAQQFRGADAPADPLAALPLLEDQGFLYAVGADLRDPFLTDLLTGCVEFIKSALDTTEAMGGGGMLPVGAMDAVTDSLPEILGQIRGSSAATYANPAGVFGGMFQRTVTYTGGDDPAAMRDMSAELYGALTPEEEEDAGAISYEHTQDAAQVEGVSLDTWSMQFDAAAMDPFMGPMLQQIYTIFMGPEPGGHIGVVGDGLMTTYSTDTAFNTACIKAAQGKGKSLAVDPHIQANREHLPTPCTLEIHVNKELFEGFAAVQLVMMGVQAPQLAGDFPPFSFAVRNGTAGAQMSLYMPADTVRAVQTFTRMMDEAFMDGMDVMEEMAEPAPAPGF